MAGINETQVETINKMLARCSFDELQQIDRVLRQYWTRARNLRDAAAARTLRVGQVVTFTTKHGQIYKGKITAFGRRMVTVDCFEPYPVSYRVSPGILRAVEAP